MSDFCLDKYQVTVSRFRKFLAAYDAGWRPAAGDGANPHIGVASGWDDAWTTNYLPMSLSSFMDIGHLDCASLLPTFEPESPDVDPEPLGINCVSWFEAFAFCIWDAGRLPTEAEWEYAASGGSLGWEYPWGDTLPDPVPAHYMFSIESPFIAVGSFPEGDGYFGHADLAGGMTEWVLDWYFNAYPASCTDCAALNPNGYRVMRGGSWRDNTPNLRAANRLYYYPHFRYDDIGIRCARSL